MTCVGLSYAIAISLYLYLIAGQELSPESGSRFLLTPQREDIHIVAPNEAAPTDATGPQVSTPASDFIRSRDCQPGCAECIKWRDGALERCRNCEQGYYPIGDHCGQLYTADFRVRTAEDEQRRQDGTQALVGWVLFLFIVLTISCCCRTFRRQICCDCLDGSSPRERETIEMEEMATAPPRTTPPVTPPPPTPPMAEAAGFVVVQNPGDEIGVGFKNAS